MSRCLGKTGTLAFSLIAIAVYFQIDMSLFKNQTLLKVKKQFEPEGSIK